MITITINHNDDIITVVNSDLPRTGKMKFTVGYRSSTREYKEFPNRTSKHYGFIRSYIRRNR